MPARVYRRRLPTFTDTALTVQTGSFLLSGRIRISSVHAVKATSPFGLRSRPLARNLPEPFAGHDDERDGEGALHAGAQGIVSFVLIGLRQFRMSDPAQVAQHIDGGLGASGLLLFLCPGMPAARAAARRTSDPLLLLFVSTPRR